MGRAIARGHSLRRFLDHKPPGAPVVLAPNHPAARDGTTKYRERVVYPLFEAPLLKRGHHNRKIGDRVCKGRLAGMPIYTLTLEERATCPRTCTDWLSCFGNKMNWSRRLIAGAALEDGLDRELRTLAAAHPGGFLVRLHVLGDFYSTDYVACWAAWLDRIPELHCFGYTARLPGTEIGDAVAALAAARWKRFAIRVSHGPHDRPRARVVDHPDQAGDAIVCPAQTGRTECCATCALCWQTRREIAFLRH